MTASFEIKFPEFPGTRYESDLKALSRAAEKIAAELCHPRYIIDPEWGEQAARATSTLSADGRHVDDRTAQAPASTRPAAGYSPRRLTNEQLQLAIDNALKVIRDGWVVGAPAGDPDTVAALLEEHLADLLEIQRERAGGA